MKSLIFAAGIFALLVTTPGVSQAGTSSTTNCPVEKIEQLIYAGPNPFVGEPGPATEYQLRNNYSVKELVTISECALLMSNNEHSPGKRQRLILLSSTARKVANEMIG